MPGAIIVGAGPLIGRSVARRFAREHMPVAVVARSHPPSMRQLPRSARTAARPWQHQPGAWEQEVHLVR